MPVEGPVALVEPSFSDLPSGGDWESVTTQGHLSRILAVLCFAGLLFGCLVGRTEILFADGLRYIALARSLEGGANAEALRRSVDHPVYPLAIAAAHRVAGGDDRPESWQAAAQWASVIAGLLLVIPFHLMVRELFGDILAFPASLLFFGLPMVGHVFADALSESTFLLFWTSGLWGALRFLRSGSPFGLSLAVLASGMAFLTRPEGLLLPAALAMTLAIHFAWVV
ncbi:MAG: ArnT family glycosyltransferase, partial [Isosphaeraceae bacterium]